MGSSEEFSGEILVGLTLRTMSWVAVCIVGPRRENRGGCTGTQTWVLVSSVRMGVMRRHQWLGEASSHRTGCRRNWRITIRAGAWVVTTWNVMLMDSHGEPVWL